MTGLGIQNIRTPEQIRNEYAAKLAGIRSRNDLSDDGRRRQLAKARVAAETAMREARKKRGADIASREESLLRALFGNTNARDATSVVSFRDAQDRAARLKKPDEAQDLLTRARRSGDVLLARAIGMHAWEQVASRPAGMNAWGAVLDAWAQDEPPAADAALTELGELHREMSGGARIMAGVQHSLEHPHELRGWNVHSLARDADSTPGEDEPT